MKKEMTGEVIEVEIDYGCGLDTYMIVSNTRQDLDDLLEEFVGKTVRITLKKVQ